MTVISAVPASFACGGYFEKHRDELPDGFLNGSEQNEVYVLSFDRIPYGLFLYDAEENRTAFRIWYEGGTSEVKKRRMLAFCVEYMIRNHHPKKLYSPACTERKAFQACGFFPKGKGMQKIVEDWRLQLDDRIFDDEGYIINQGMMKEIPYGWFDTAAKGCGWIAAYNLLKINGMETTMDECVKGVEKGAILGGVMGSEIVMITLWLRKKGLKAKMTIPSDYLSLRTAQHSGSGIVLYTHSRGAHYTAYRRNQDGSMQFYNAVYGRRNHVVQLNDFLKQHSLFPVSSLIYVEDSNDQ